MKRLIAILLGIVALVLPASALCSAPLPAALAAAESSLAASHFQRAASHFAGVAADVSLPASLRGRALRGQALSHEARMEGAQAAAALARAVAADVNFPGNTALVDQLRHELELHGRPHGFDELLSGLEAAAATVPSLRASVTRLRMQDLRMAGRFDEADVLARGLAPVTDFLVLGAFDNTGGAGLDEPFPPEAGVNPDGVERDPKGRMIRWHRATANADGEIDLDTWLADEQDAVGYAATFVRPSVPGPAVLHLGGSGSFRVWLNGTLVVDEPHLRSGNPDFCEVPVRLEVDRNRLLVKAAAETERLAFRLRFTDPAGNPLPVESDPSPVGATPAAVTVPSPDEEVPAGLARFPEDSGLRRWVASAGEAPLADVIYLLDSLFNVRLTDEYDNQLDAAFDRFGVGEPGAMPIAVPSLEAPALLCERRNNALLARGDVPQWMEQNRRLVHDAPELFTAHWALIYKLVEEGELDSCWVALEGAYASFPTNAEVRALHGSLTVIRGDVQAGLEEVRQAVADAPGNMIARDRQISMLDALSDNTLLEGALRDALGARPDHAAYARRLAALAYSGGRHDEALEHLRHALRAGARREVILLEVAMVQRAAGRTDEAIATLEEAAQISPQQSTVAALLAEFLLQQGRTADARRWMERTVELDPLSFDTRRRLEELNGCRSPRELLPSEDVEKLLRDDLSWADSSAGAVMLFDAVSLICYSDGSRERWHHVVIKTLNEAGVDAVRTLEVPWDLSGDTVEIARTLKADGRRIEAERGFTEVAFADLAPGDAVELRTVVALGSTPGLPEHYWNDHMFQSSWPCLKSRLAVLAPPGKVLHTQLHNISLDPKVSEPSEWVLTVWQTEKLPAFATETASPPFREHAAWLDVSTVPSWESLVQWYDGVVRGRTRVTRALRLHADSLSAELAANAPPPDGAAADSALIHHVADFVRRTVRYEGGQFVDSGYIPRTADKVLEDRFGDCKDEAVLIVALLRYLGIGANVALVNARDETTVPYLPSLRFTHAIVRARAADGRTFWIDPTAKELEFPNVPVLLEGASALVIQPNVVEFCLIDSDPPEANGHESTADATVDAEGTLVQTGAYHLVGEDAASFREAAHAALDEQRQLAEAILGNAHPGAIVRSCAFVAIEGEGTRFDYVMEQRGFASRASDLLIVPMPWTLATVPETAAASESRRLPLALDSWKGRYKDEIRLRLPEGYDVVSVPSGAEVSSPMGSFRLGCDRPEPGLLILRRILQIDVHRVEPPDYEEFRRFVRDAASAEKELIVLARRKG
jgi:tetratricopeptide (TPR) repeat protein